jgi:hypothetical protein
VTQTDQSAANYPQVEPGSAARALIAQAKTLSAAITAAPAALGTRREQARNAYELFRTDVIRKQLDELPLDKIKEVTQGRLRLTAIERAGYGSIGAVLRAGPAVLQSVPGVGPQTAAQVIAAARNFQVTLERQTRVRFDPDARTPAQARLLARLYAYEQVKANIPPQAPDYASLAADLDALAAEAKPTASRR